MEMQKIKKVKTVEPPWPFEAYTHVISPLSDEDGGGFLFTMPDIPGCMSDGATEIEAIENGRDAFLCTVAALTDMGREVPKPRYYHPPVAAQASERVVACVPKHV